VGVFGLKRTVNGQVERGYGIKIGGGLSSSPKLAKLLPVFLQPAQVWPVIEAVSKIFRDHGYRLKRNNARLKFLVEDWWKLGGGERGGGEYLARKVEELLPFKLERHHDFTVITDQETDHVGVHKQRQGDLYWVGICFPGGRLRNQALKHVSGLAEKYCAPGQDQIRLTNKQNLLIVNVPEANLAALKAELDELDFDYQPSNFRKGCVSCTGIEFCNLAVSETKNRMLELIGQLETASGWYKDKIRIHFSGCPSSCGQHQIADIGFRGARTKANRRFNELLKGKILAKDVHLFVDKLLKVYDAKKQGKETFAEFTDRVPKEEILKALDWK
jgi:ferredoxin-nitrite reductase